MLIIDLIVGVALGYIPGVDNFAHLGGFLMGLLCAAILYPVISETKRHKMIMWAVRIAAIPLAVVLFVTLIRNFYSTDPFAGECSRVLMRGMAAHNGCRFVQHADGVDICRVYLQGRIISVKGMQYILNIFPLRGMVTHVLPS